MVTQIFSRVIPKTQTLTSLFSRSLSTATTATLPSSSAISFLHRLRPLSASAITSPGVLPNPNRALSTRATTSSLRDPNPNWSNRPPKETILLDGCDFEHWLVVMEKPEGDPTRDEIIDGYIKTLAKVIGSDEAARMKIYSVSTRHYFAFGALVSEELSYKLKELPNVRWVLPDSYLNVREKDYGGEPFINGQAVPYDPKYHEEWVRNHVRTFDRNRGKEKRRINDRSRNINRRRENVVNRDMQTRPPMQNPGPNMHAPPQNNNAGSFPPNNAGGYPPNDRGGYPPAPPSNQGGYAPPNASSGYAPNNTAGCYSPPTNYGPSPVGGMPQNNNAGGFPPNNAGGYPPNNRGGYAPNNTSGGYSPPTNYGPGPVPQNNNAGRYPPNNRGGYAPNNTAGGYSTTPNSGYAPGPVGGMPQNNYSGNMGGVPENQNRGEFPPNARWANYQ